MSTPIVNLEPPDPNEPVPTATPQGIVFVQAPRGPAVPQKDPSVTFLLDLFLGAFGAHRFYLGQVGAGMGYLLTLGLLGVLPIIDLFRAKTLTAKVNRANGW